MNQPAAPAAMIVTTRFLIGSAERPASEAPHIRSAILKTSQPSAAKPTPQKRMTETTAFLPFPYLQTPYDVLPGCIK
jgi:hypothetical protein